MPILVELVEKLEVRINNSDYIRYVSKESGRQYAKIVQRYFRLVVENENINRELLLAGKYLEMSDKQNIKLEKCYQRIIKLKRIINGNT